MNFNGFILIIMSEMKSQQRASNAHHVLTRDPQVAQPLWNSGGASANLNYFHLPTPYSKSTIHVTYFLSQAKKCLE